MQPEHQEAEMEERQVQEGQVPMEQTPVVLACATEYTHPWPGLLKCLGWFSTFVTPALIIFAITVHIIVALTASGGPTDTKQPVHLIIFIAIWPMTVIRFWQLSTYVLRTPDDMLILKNAMGYTTLEIPVREVDKLGLPSHCRGWGCKRRGKKRVLLLTPSKTFAQKWKEDNRCKCHRTPNANFTIELSERCCEALLADTGFADGDLERGLNTS
mmetsp:Transcript_228/g.615  ORF Transcript_228/g.615 Transcript_228/m.615 type:complete len:214 (-) Transcript_228:82-723(-)